MEKIYGYKREDGISLCELIKSKPSYSPSRLFDEYSAVSGKSKGTVRNMYYALAKVSKADKKFCDEYLDGKSLEIGKIESFADGDDLDLVKKVLNLKNQGFSVRKAVRVLANGDDKLALRYMNKYRSTIKSKPSVLDLAIEELGIEREGNSKPVEVKELVSEVQLRRLKNQINSLVFRISDKVRRENEYLKQRVSALEMQNLRLSNMLCGEKPNTVLKFFNKKGNNTEFIN